MSGVFEIEQLVDIILLLLLLCSQLYLWSSPFLGRFLRVRPSFNLTIEVVAFRLLCVCVCGGGGGVD